MFTTLTIAAAWFSFGYSVTDLLTTIVQKHKAGKYDRRKKQTPVRITTGGGN